MNTKALAGKGVMRAGAMAILLLGIAVNAPTALAMRSSNEYESACGKRCHAGRGDGHPAFGYCRKCAPDRRSLSDEATAIVSSVKSKNSMRSLCKGGLSDISNKVMTAAATLMATGTVTDPRTSGKEATKELASQCQRRK